MRESGRTVAITGVAHYWGELLAICLQEDPRVDRVLAVDTESPRVQLSKLEHIQVDARNPQLPGILEQHGVSVLFHTDIIKRRAYDEAVFAHNLLGTMHLFSACANAGVEKIILKSSARVYGARYDNPSFLGEGQPIRAGHAKYQYNRDYYEIEKHAAEFAQEWPQVELVVLRFCHGLGPTAVTPMSEFLDARVTPVLMGFDPLFQLIHEDDLVRALYHAYDAVPAGIYNVAPDGVVPLSKILRRTSRIPAPIPHPLAYVMADATGAMGRKNPFPLELDYLRYSVVVDNRKMSSDMAFRPAYDTEAVLSDYVEHRVSPPRSLDQAYRYLQAKRDRVLEMVGLTPAGEAP